MRLNVSATLLALVSSSVACSHHVRREALSAGPSLGLSARFVSLLKRQRQSKQNVKMFLNRVQNTSAPLFACYLGGEAGREPKDALQSTTVNLGNEEPDPNNDLGVTSYFLSDGGQAIMFDTLTSPVLASACLDMVQSDKQAGIGQVQQVVLSHKHQDHIAGVSAPELKQAKIITQDNTRQALAAARSRAPDETYTESKNLMVGQSNVTLLHFVGHTNDGTGACMGDVCLMGDECEDSVPFIAEPERIQSQIANLNSTIKTVQSRGIDKVCPAHGSGNTIAGGCFSLSLCQSNMRYLQLMASDLQTACGMSLQQLAPQFGRQSEEVTQAYAGVHKENCESLSQAQGGRRGRRGG
ncbi:Amidase signature domain protein [Ophiocordyceps camponoti-floridani]|uniref:Amidase signature domain protein n=1 Tax=Ophiocordyceps camponoti-floridani TaxID=2030778 RepID=A0A8H4VGS4_9HYPO|nr:Amidase signature domain protein [Ophiocordyceps camponoti-floridani]